MAFRDKVTGFPMFAVVPDSMAVTLTVPITKAKLSSIGKEKALHRTYVGLTIGLELIANYLLSTKLS